MLPAIVYRLEETRSDPALGTRGARKLLVTELYAGSEVPADRIEWRAAMPCPVQVMRDTELAVFNEKARQTRHCHRAGTEIYMVMDGQMCIEVEGQDYQLSAGDVIVVNPGAYHQVKQEGSFLCRVITVNCGGGADRHE